MCPAAYIFTEMTRVVSHHDMPVPIWVLGLHMHAQLNGLDPTTDGVRKVGRSSWAACILLGSSTERELEL